MIMMGVGKKLLQEMSIFKVYNDDFFLENYQMILKYVPILKIANKQDNSMNV